ncbi:MAG: hypothetical protein Q9174_002661 [Haloplaca sp. 1 TL-2023]
MGKRDWTTAPRKGSRESKRLKRESPSPAPYDTDPIPSALAAGKGNATLATFECVDDAPCPCPYVNTDRLEEKMHDQYDNAIARAGPFISRCLQQQQHMDAPSFEYDSRPFVRWFRRSSTDSACVETGYLRVGQLAQETRVGAFARISLDDEVSPIKPRRKYKTNAAKPQRALEIHREDKGGEGEAEYYLRWCDSTKVVVNGRGYDGVPGIEGDIAIGPLPDYAVIEVEENVAFWWKNEGGLGHIRQKFSEELKHRNQWYQIWQRKFYINMAAMAHARERAAASSDDPACRVEWSENLEAEQVYLGIAAVWKALRDSGTIYAFNGDIENQQIRYNREDDEGFFASSFGSTVDGPCSFVLPLVYDFEQISQPSSPTSGRFSENQSTPKKSWGNGHTLFAFVERNTDDTISVKLLDSCRDASVELLTMPRIEASIERVVRRSGWLSQDWKGNPAALDFEPRFEFQIINVPNQESPSSCGVHTILNAWATMLGLPRHNLEERFFQPPFAARRVESMRRTEEEATFMEFALDMVNLAMAGETDLRTIEAFLSWTGFCQVQDPIGQGARMERTVLMNAVKLSGILNDLRE